MNVLMFAGTGDGRDLAARLADLPLTLHIRVATDYGVAALTDLPAAARVAAGRLDGDAIVRLIREEAIDVVVDATHPYAASAREAIRVAAAVAGVPRLRLARPASGDGGLSLTDAAARVATLSGNVLLTSGASTIAAFAAVPDFAARVYARILPDAGSLARCLEAGLPRSHIIAMQGPFSVDLNRALIRHFAIAVLVTKDGGARGGFPEKSRAAREEGAELVVIARPPEEAGLGAADIVAEVRRRLEGSA